jgi:hypothetical protein
MADMTVSRLGADDGGSDKKALFLKQYGGEVLTAFEENNVFADKHITRTIKSGKSAQFPVTGKKDAAYHTPGAEITGTVMKHGERVITIDDLLISDSFIANIDEAMNHYDVRSEYTRQDGAALARAFDKNIASVGLNAARASATLTGGNGGSTINGSNFKTSGSDLAGGIMDAAQAFDEKDVPEMERFAFVKPAQYYLLVETDKISNRYSDEQSGSYRKGKVYEIGGIEIVKTNNLPTTNITGSVKSDYDGDFRNTAALVMHRSAVGTVKLLDLSVESEYLIKHQGTLMVSKFLLGSGILRPESSIELRTADPA